MDMQHFKPVSFGGCILFSYSESIKKFYRFLLLFEFLKEHLKNIAILHILNSAWEKGYMTKGL